MITHNLKQGTEEWLKDRHLHYNASEAAAMLGLDKRTSRTKLLQMKNNGFEKEFSEFVQKNLLDKGHEVEALARVLLEAEIGEDLFPICVSEGNLYCSFDGLNMAGTIGFEHKMWNEDLSESVKNGIVPDSHMPQLQQLLMVSGAEKIIFVVSDGTLEKRVLTEVFPDEEWFRRIRDGWIQFEKDLQNHVPAQEVETVTADVIEDLPSPFIQTEGSIIIRSNLDKFGVKLTEFVSSIDLEPEDDQGFANAEAAVKILKKAQESLESAEASALAQTASVDDMRRAVAKYIEQARSVRIKLEKIVKNRKEQLKAEIVTDGKIKWRDHLLQIEEEIKPINLTAFPSPDFVGAIKGLKTIISLRDAIDTTLANAKIAIDSEAREIRKKLNWLSENSSGYELLFPDIQQIIWKPFEDFTLLSKSRIEQHKKDEEARLEEERKKIRIEEQEKANKYNGSSTLNPEIVSFAPQVAVIDPVPVPRTLGVADIVVGVTDMVALCREIAEGRAPADLIMPNTDKMQAWIQSKNIRTFPGLSIREI